MGAFMGAFMGALDAGFLAIFLGAAFLVAAIFYPFTRSNPGFAFFAFALAFLLLSARIAPAASIETSGFFEISF